MASTNGQNYPIGTAEPTGDRFTQAVESLRKGELDDLRERVAELEKILKAPDPSVTLARGLSDSGVLDAPAKVAALEAEVKALRLTVSKMVPRVKVPKQRRPKVVVMPAKSRRSKIKARRDANGDWDIEVEGEG